MRPRALRQCALYIYICTSARFFAMQSSAVLSAVLILCEIMFIKSEMRCIVCKVLASTAKKSITACKVRHLITAPITATILCLELLFLAIIFTQTHEFNTNISFLIISKLVQKKQKKQKKQKIDLVNDSFFFYLFIFFFSDIFIFRPQP